MKFLVPSGLKADTNLGMLIILYSRNFVKKKNTRNPVLSVFDCKWLPNLKYTFVLLQGILSYRLKKSMLILNIIYDNMIKN